VGKTNYTHSANNTTSTSINKNLISKSKSSCSHTASHIFRAFYQIKSRRTRREISYLYSNKMDRIGLSKRVLFLNFVLCCFQTFKTIKFKSKKRPLQSTFILSGPKSTFYRLFCFKNRLFGLKNLPLCKVSSKFAFMKCREV